MIGGDELMYPVDAADWEGLPDTSEHRTVGPHRAWCHADTEWCYPEDLCWCCDQTKVPDRWRGEHVGAVLLEIRQLLNDRLDTSRPEYNLGIGHGIDIACGRTP
jgi:hypothetical protein